MCQLLLDSIKAYNSLLPLVIVLPRQDLAGTGELAVHMTSSGLPLRQQTCAACLQPLAGCCNLDVACIYWVQSCGFALQHYKQFPTTPLSTWPVLPLCYTLRKPRSQDCKCLFPSLWPACLQLPTDACVTIVITADVTHMPSMPSVTCMLLFASHEQKSWH